MTAPSINGAASMSTAVPEWHIRPGRILIVAFDGTADLFDTSITNVVHLVSFLKKNDNQKQMIYYQTGIGTEMKPGRAMTASVKIQQLMDQAFASDLANHVMGGYTFLMDNWLPQDKICIFGFSRGAYTARALAGMLHKVGLLPRGNVEQVAFAYQMFSQRDARGWSLSSAFKKTFCTSVSIDFMGVWETVSAVGVVSGKTLPFTGSDHHIRVFRQAVGLDERRCKFRPNLWHYSPLPGEAPPTSLTSAPAPNGQEQGVPIKGQHNYTTDVMEVWFAGGHGDVGGGNVPNTELNSMNRIPLIWMIREIILANTGILWDEDAIRDAGFEFPIVPPTQPTNGVSHSLSPNLYLSNLDKRYGDDVIAPGHDQLDAHWAWWILEYLPLRYTWQQSDGHWKSVIRCNRARPRHIPTEPPPTKVHVSVRERMKRLAYEPVAHWKGEADWVE